jgi:uncharacterized protein (TIGR03437 family)
MKTLHAAALLCVISLTLSAQNIRVVNAASLSSGSVAPGSIITIFGTKLTSGVASATDATKPPSTLGGVTVSIGGSAAALFYVSPTQINAVVDPATPTGSQTVTVTSTATGTQTGSVTISTTAAAGLFSLTGAGTRDGAVVNALTGGLMNFSTQTSNQATYLELFATGLNSVPSVMIGGVSAQVTFSGPAGWAAGLEQINVIVPSSVAGAGRVPVVITANGQASNTVQIVVLPPAAQSEFPGDQDNHARARELAALAYIPGTSSVLSTDENDDVVRVIDVNAKKVTHVFALPEGAAPVGVAVNAAGTMAVVAESGRGMAAILNLSTYSVAAEVPVGAGPTAVAISGSQAVVVNQDADSVTVFNLTSRTPATVSVGRGPAGVAVDAAGNGYVTNEDDGTVSVIALSATPSVTKTIALGASSLRPEAIAVNAGTAYITVPAAGPDGMVVVLNLATGVTTTISANPDRSGGSSDVAISASNVYFANQTGGSVSVLPLNGTTITSVKTDLGARALAIDTKDNLLVVSNEGTGTLVMVSLSSNTVTGRINAVQTSPGDQNDHSDRNNATNLPVIVSMTPTSAKGGATFTLTITGTNFTGATAVNFGANGSGNRSSDFTVSKISVNSTGTQLTAIVSLDASAKPGARIVSVTTPNGDSTDKGVGAAVFMVTP